jgi:cytochrome o ubiquinol oxidase operon protein cyoD
MVESTHARHDGRFPWAHIVGYVLSLVLTAAAFWLVLTHRMGVAPTLFIIVVLGVLQIFVQLFFFMHITESDGPPWHTMMLLVGFLFVVVIVGGSIWIMSFNAQVA